MKKAIYKGFTLIELLVVISIIGVIVAFAMFGMQGAFEASRDTNRKSDLEQYEVALEIFANNNNTFYPAYPLGTDLATVCTSNLGLATCPDDPDDAVSYTYISNGTPGGNDATNYAISADLEGDDDYDWMVCSGGIVGEAGQPSTDGSCMVGSAPPEEGETCDDAECNASCLAVQPGIGGSCVGGACVCQDDLGGEGECTDSDAAMAGSQYTGGYVNDVNGVVTLDWCDPSLGAVIEQVCSGGGTAVGTPISCDFGTTCVSDPSGAYCPSGGGGCEEAGCNASCAFGGYCNFLLDECVCNDDPDPAGGGGCTDTDGGDNPSQGGIATGISGVYSDSCTGFGGLIEYWCDPVTTSVSQTNYPFCPNGTPCVPGPNGDFCN